MSFAILAPNGTNLKGLNSTGLFPLKDIEGPTGIFREGCILSWKETFRLSELPSNRITGPEIIIGETFRITILFITDTAVQATVETTKPAEMPMLIEQTVSYLGGKISTFDIRPSQPNSFVGGLANDLRRLAEIVRRRWCNATRRIRVAWQLAH